MKKLITDVNGQVVEYEADYELVWRNVNKETETVLFAMKFPEGEDVPPLEAVTGIDEDLDKDPRNAMRTNLYIRDLSIEVPEPAQEDDTDQQDNVIQFPKSEEKEDE